MAKLTDDNAVDWVGQAKREKRLNSSCDGAHGVVPFQCEACWIRNLTGRKMSLPHDTNLRMCIRRTSLDAFAGKAKSTIASHVGGINRAVKTSALLGKPPSLSQTPRGPMVIGDPLGMSLAVEMVHYSITAKGRIDEKIQFDTMRKLRSTYTRGYDSSPQGVLEVSSFSQGSSKVRSTSSPAQSVWFSDFLIGAQDRMGYNTQAQLSLPIKVVVHMLDLIKADAGQRTSLQERSLLKFGAYITILTAASLRGHEGFFLDLAATQNLIQKGKSGVVPPKFSSNKVLSEEEIENLPYVTICLLGKFKGETGERYHSIVLASQTMSGLEVRWWVEQLLKLCAMEGRTSGYAFDELDGAPPDTTEYNALLRQYLRRIQLDCPKQFPPEEDVTRYGINRTLRKTAVSRAGRAGLSGDLFNPMNRWRTVESAKGSRPKHNMRTHYTDARALAPMTWRYSYVQ